ncbi:MAG: hypothetical protein ACM3PP_02770 [Candidatus Saccharibacteria bacterium]
MNRKYLIIIILIIAALGLSIGLLDNKDVQGGAQKHQAGNNRQSFGRIETQVNTFLNKCNNGKSTFTEKSADANQESSEGGTITGYFDGSKLMFIESNFFGETGQIKHEVYFINNSLSYLATTEMKYDKPITIPDSKVVQEVKTEYVIIDNQPNLYDKTAKKIIPAKDTKDILKMIDSMRKPITNTANNVKDQ